MDGVTIRDFAAAITAGDISRVQSMLRAKPELADMQMSYGDERRPIHFAVIARSLDMVRLLMRHGANPHAGVHPHRDATTAWIMAKERGYDELLPILVAVEQEAAPAAPSSEPDAYTPDEAREAVAAGDLEWLRARHAAGTLTNSIDSDGAGLLTVAVEQEQLAILEFLLDCGFDPNERGSDNQAKPLWHAAAIGNIELATALLRRGADPNAHVDSSGSAVYSALSHRQWRMAEFLQSRGGIVTADIAGLYRLTDVARDLAAKDASELLQFGACGGATDIVQMALEHIDWPAGDARWFRSLTEPLSFWHHIPWLYAGNKDFDREGYLQCFRMILDRSGPNPIGGFHRCPLHEVAAMGDWITDREATAFANALLQGGAKLDVRDELLESTTLGWACRWGREGVVKALLDHGANPVEPDAKPWATPLAWAEVRGHTAIAQLLRTR